LLAFFGLDPPLTLTKLLPIKVIPQNIPVSVPFGTFVSAVRKRPRSASLAAMITKEIAFIPIEANMLLPALRAQCNE